MTIQTSLRCTAIAAIVLATSIGAANAGVEGMNLHIAPVLRTGPTIVVPHLPEIRFHAKGRDPKYWERVESNCVGTVATRDKNGRLLHHGQGYLPPGTDLSGYHGGGQLVIDCK